MEKHMLKQLIDRFESSTFTVNRILHACIRELMPDNVTADQHSILRYIRERGLCTSSELADFFFVGKSSITAIVKRLADKNLIQRILDEKDRRVIYLSLTAEGEEFVEGMQEKIAELLTKFINHFDAQEAYTFIETYEKLARILVEEEGGKGRE